MTKIKIGLFFDGTGNNGYNAESKKHNSPSYHSSSTNIFRLYKNYENVCANDPYKKAVYVEGIGTVKGKKDSIWNKAQGDSSIKEEYGAESKIKLATKYIHEKLVELSYTDNIDLEFNIFGFSRGAALARHYANQLSDTKSPVYENIKKSLVNNKTKLNKIKINFLGLYDTVESFGSFGGFNAITSVANLKDVGCIFQLRAEHECRENFPLTSILNKKKSEMVDKYRGYSERNLNNSKLIEVLVPGNHSDVGGSYLDYLKEYRSVECRVFNDTCKSELKQIQKNPIWTKLLDDKHIEYEHEFSVNWKYWFAISKRQEIRAQLQWVYAKLMIMIANKYNCEFDLSDFDKDYDIPDDLKPIYEQLFQIIKELDNLQNCENITQINRNTIDKITDKYIHISANWNALSSKEETPSTQPITYNEYNVEATLSLDKTRIYRPRKDWKRDILFK